MATSVSSVEEVCNLALDRVAYARSITSIWAGTKEARVALRNYGQTRDDLLRDGEWGFAQRETALTLLKSAPVGGYNPMAGWTSASPQLPWKFEYAYPSDCLKIRSLRGTPIFLPEFAPRPVVFNIANDSTQTPAAKVILTNLPSAIATYTGQIVDMTTWEASFVEALVDALARRFAEALAPVEAKEQEGMAERSNAVAGMARG